MPRYFYVAKSVDGEFKTESLEAKDKKELAKILHEEGYVLVKADIEETEKKKRSGISLPFSRGVSLTEKLMFTRNLQVMISAGVSLPKCLTILSSQSQNKKFKKALAEVLEGVNKGESFSEGLKKYPGVFSELFTSMIKVGEESGTMENVLKNLTLQMEREHDLKSKIIGAMIYPAVIMTALIGIGILMMIMVVPKLSETFTELGVDLPPATKLVILIGNSLAKYWFLLPVLILSLFFILRRIIKTKTGKRYFERR